MSKDEYIKRIEGAMGIEFPEEQVDILTSFNRPLNVISCAGSGKTTLMIAKLCYMQMRYGVNPASIIVISFNRSAVEEIKGRYRGLVSVLGLSDRVAFKTFHALYYMILRYYAREVFGGEGIRVLSEGQAASLYNRAFYEKSKVKTDDARDNILSLRSFALNNMVYTREQLMGNPRFIESDVDIEDYLNVIERYRELKKENKGVDFEDLQHLMLKLMMENKDARERVRGAWDYWFIDEYQDICKIQMEILNLTLKDSNKLVTIGDEDQCIYEFRGSKVDYIVDFPVFFDNAERLTMDYNYRCPSVILKKADNMIKNNTKRTNKQMKAYREGGEVVYQGSSSLVEASLGIADEIYGDFMSGKDLSEVAVLYRVSSQQIFIVDRLVQLGVPVNVVRKSNLLYDHLVVTDIINIIELAIDETDPYKFQKVFTKITDYVSRADVKEVMGEMLKYGGSWRDYVDFRNESVGRASEVLREIKGLVEKKDMMVNILPLVLGIYNNFLYFLCDSRKMRVEDMSDLLEYLSFIGMDKTYKEFLFYLDRARSVVGNCQGVKEAVMVTTMHTVKGLEFSNVYILDASDGVIPCDGRVEVLKGMFGDVVASDYIEQERRLMYVACTRAKERLYVSFNKDDPSRFILEMLEGTGCDFEKLGSEERIVFTE